jgi:hypothetical protein
VWSSLSSSTRHFVGVEPLPGSVLIGSGTSVSHNGRHPGGAPRGHMGLMHPAFKPTYFANPTVSGASRFTSSFT